MPTKAPSPNAAARDVCSKSFAIGPCTMDGILSLIGMSGKNRFRRFTMPKIMRMEAPSFPMKCGVEKRCSTLRSPSPMRRYEAKMPAMYTPPICNIFSRDNCNPNKNAIVMRRIENEQGCTLSRSDDMSTRGRSHAPPPLALQMSVDVAGLNLRIMIPRMNAPTTPAMMRSRFMLGGYERLYLEFKRAAHGVGQSYEPVYLPDAGGAMRIGVIHNADNTALAGLDELICRWNCTAVTCHSERPFGASIRPYDEGVRAHARREYGLNGNVVFRRIGHGEILRDYEVFHRDGAEVVERLGSDERAFRSIRAGASLSGWSAAFCGVTPREEADDD